MTPGSANRAQPEPRQALQPGHWDRQYRGEPVWDTGRPCNELRRVLRAYRLAPRWAIELGCGRGANAIWLARQGAATTANDLSPVAIDSARRRAREMGASVDWRVGDLRRLPEDLNGRFGFAFDRGCYHSVRRVDPEGYLRTLVRLLEPGGCALVLTGNAHEPEDEVGPPVVSARELIDELSRGLELVALFKFRWDARPGKRQYLGWSCLLRRSRGLSPRPLGAG